MDIRHGRMVKPDPDEWQLPSVPVVAARREALTPSIGPFDLNVALVGCGAQGRTLCASFGQFPGLRIRALCDLVASRRENLARTIGQGGQTVGLYESCAEMLAAESGIDAVVLATPDAHHAGDAVRAMEAGAHVYCEAPMAHRIADAEAMVATARRLDKRLQTGMQRRGNIAYRVGMADFALSGDLGVIVYAQAECSHKLTPVAPVPGEELDIDAINRHGFSTATDFLNWRWYRRHSAGPFAQWGVHQMDLFNWAFQASPATILASGGQDFVSIGDHADNGGALLEYDTAAGSRRAMFSMNASSSAGGVAEIIHGENATLRCMNYQRRSVWVTNYLLPGATRDRIEAAVQGGRIEVLGVRWADLLTYLALYRAPVNMLNPISSEPCDYFGWNITAPFAHPPQHYLLANFFDAIQSGAPLWCPPETALAATRAALTASAAIDRPTPLPLG